MNATTKPKPGDLCRFVKDESGRIVAVEHVAPCLDGHRTGTVTDIRTGEVIR